MGLLVAVLCIVVVALAIVVYRVERALIELKNAHVNLAAEVGVVRRESASSATKLRDDLAKFISLTNDSFRVRLDQSASYAAALNERLVLLEIEKTAAPKPPDEPPSSRRSFASQKARAEAGARK